MSKPAYMYKAIETKFDSYHFRSRLEARWAVFFKTLGLEYHYEPEGYVLEGIPYLPDFYLPQLDSFIEIKGAVPTSEELQKARLLALYTQKDVYVISGNIGLPDDPYRHRIHYEYSPTLFICKRDEERNTVEHIKRDVSSEVLAILQKLEEAEIIPTVGIPGWPLVLCYPLWLRYQVNQIPHFLHDMQQKHDALLAIAPLLNKYEEELTQALTVEEGWLFDFRRTDTGTDDLEWCQCLKCGEITLWLEEDFSNEHFHCPKIDGKLVNDSPRLIEAFTAARQARF